MTKSDKQDELAEALLRWAEKDEDNRSVMLIAGDEESVRNTYYGSRVNIIESLAEAMRTDKELRSICANALFMYFQNKAKYNDKAKTNNN